MRIDGTNSFNGPIAPHIARAYGLPATRPTMSIGPAQPASPTAQSGSIDKLPSPAQALVAGRVDGPIEFDGVSVPRSNPSALSLYTRAADRIEAATAVHIGRTIDVKG